MISSSPPMPWPLGVSSNCSGISTHNWQYPHGDILGLPYWFITIWLIVEILGRRLVIPLFAWLAGWCTGNRFVHLLGLLLPELLSRRKMAAEKSLAVPTAVFRSPDVGR